MLRQVDIAGAVFIIAESNPPTHGNANAPDAFAVAGQSMQTIFSFLLQQWQRFRHFQYIEDSGNPPNMLRRQFPRILLL